MDRQTFQASLTLEVDGDTLDENVVAQITDFAFGEVDTLPKVTLPGTLEGPIIESLYQGMMARRHTIHARPYERTLWSLL